MTAKDLLYGWAGGNVWLFHVINAQPPSWLDQAMSFATWVGDYRTFPLYLGIWLLAVWHSRRAARPERAARMLVHALRFATGGVVVLLLIGGLKLAFDLPRPLVVLGSGSVRLLAGTETHYSLPSGHSAVIMLLAASIWPLVKWPWRCGLLALVLCVGVSRVWLGEHFPADVLAGYAIGLLGALGATRIIRYPAPALADSVETRT